jgi:hypothetical protein
VSALLRLYPPAWRARYGDEMTSLLESRPLGWSDRVDLATGAIDAWLHPARPSRVPTVAALLGGGLWTVIATAVLLQPAPPDWPGYLAEVLPIALIGSLTLLVATIGCALRLGDGVGWTAPVTVSVVVVGSLAWSIALVLALTAGLSPPLLAAAQSVAMVGMTLIGSRLVLAGDLAIGVPLVGGAVAMLVPWAAGWLVFGTAWTAIGIVLWMGHLARPGRAGLAG